MSGNNEGGFAKQALRFLWQKLMGDDREGKRWAGVGMLELFEKGEELLFCSGSLMLYKCGIIVGLLICTLELRTCEYSGDMYTVCPCEGILIQLHELVYDTV